MSRALFYLWLAVLLLCCAGHAEDAKPKVAVFPLGGDAAEDLREKVGYSLRAKLDRDGYYEPIDGPMMLDIAGDAAIDFQTSLKAVQDLGKEAGAEVLMWGELDKGPGGQGAVVLRVKVFDLDQPDPLPHEFEKVIAQPTDMRFVVENILQTLEKVKRFEHPSEEAVVDDVNARALFAKKPNLVQNGDFSVPGYWHAILGSDDYVPDISDALPEIDRVDVYRMPIDNGQAKKVLAMNLSKEVAENNGLACLSDPIAVEPNTRYRLSFRYRSDGPSLHVFVKGYSTMKNLRGENAEREVYRRQVPPSGATDGEWATVTCDLSPRHVAVAVEHLRVDLYAYLAPGVVMFDDVQLKAVGEAIRESATQP